MGVVFSRTMKCLVAVILALPCLAEPDIFSYSPFLGRFIWSAEPGVQPSVYVANRRPYRPAYPFQNGLAGSLYRRHNIWGGYAPSNIIYHSAGKFLPSVINIAAPSIDINANPASVGHITPLSSSYHSIRSLVTPTGTLNEIPASAGHKSPQSI